MEQDQEPDDDDAIAGHLVHRHRGVDQLLDTVGQRLHQGKQLADAEESEAAAGAMLKEEVGPEDVAEVVSTWTGIPVGKMLEGETEKLLRMEDELPTTPPIPAGIGGVLGGPQRAISDA